MTFKKYCSVSVKHLSKNRTEREDCICRSEVQLLTLQEVTKPQVQMNFYTCTLSLDRILTLNLNFQCLSVSSIWSLYSVAPVLKFPGTCLCLECRYLLAHQEPWCSSQYFQRIHIEDSTPRVHLMSQPQYTAASFFWCSTSWTDGRAIGQTGFQPHLHLQGYSHCQENDLMVRLFNYSWAGKFFCPNISSNTQHQTITK